MYAPLVLYEVVNLIWICDSIYLAILWTYIQPFASFFWRLVCIGCSDTAFCKESDALICKALVYNLK